MKILITAFEPFDHNNDNFSHDVLLKLTDKSHIIKSLLPVEYIGSVRKIKEEINKHKPNIIIMLGEARSYQSLGFEVIGINEYSERADNVGFVPTKRRIFEGGKDGIFSTLDYDLFVKAMNEAKTKHHRSFSVGTYVCNTLLYSTLKIIEDENLNIKAGFIHIPDLKEQNIDEIISGLNNFVNKL